MHPSYFRQVIAITRRVNRTNNILCDIKSMILHLDNFFGGMQKLIAAYPSNNSILSLTCDFGFLSTMTCYLECPSTNLKKSLFLIRLVPNFQGPTGLIPTQHGVLRFYKIRYNRVNGNNWKLDTSNRN